MCGRFSLAKTTLDKEYNLDREATLIPNFNVTPGISIPVIINQNGKNLLELMHWEFRLGSDSNSFNLINAKAETLEEKRTFSHLLDKGRCLIPATGFYEWLRTENGKIPHYIHLTDRELFGFAGLYRQIKHSGSGQTEYEVVIITTSPNKTMEKIHNRMPVILLKGDERQWLDTSKPFSEVKHLLSPYPDDQMTAFPISRQVNNPRNNGPELTEEFEYELSL